MSNIFQYLHLTSDCFYKEMPCFHRPIMIQNDSTHPHSVTHTISGSSDVEFQNKSPEKCQIFEVFTPKFRLILKGNALFPQTNYGSE